MHYLLSSDTNDGYMNLARDEHILNMLAPGDRFLFLYVNANAVIIGRNQNPWRECNTHAMELDGVQLVRRASGGGAVMHDAGNLNFSFICEKSLYDEREQTGVILDALASLGIRAEVTGRNDITVDGKKVSGNAYCQRGNNMQRHGTLLVDANTSAFDRYLNAPKQKLIAKGVTSVKSRVCNLRECLPSLTVDGMTRALIDAYTRKYGEIQNYAFTDADARAIQILYDKHKSWDWRMGEAPRFDYSIENRFPWGMAELCLSVEGGRVKAAKLFTDALNVDLPSLIEPLCAGARFDMGEIAERLSAGGREAVDLAEYLLKNK